MVALGLRQCVKNHELLVPANQNKHSENREKTQGRVKLKEKVEKEKYETGKQQKTVDDIEKTVK